MFNLYLAYCQSANAPIISDKNLNTR